MAANPSPRGLKDIDPLQLDAMEGSTNLLLQEAAVAKDSTHDIF
jgi:hypothetical protein